MRSRVQGVRGDCEKVRSKGVNVTKEKKSRQKFKGVVIKKKKRREPRESCAPRATKLWPEMSVTASPRP